MPQQQRRPLVLSDFDGTLTKGDTFQAFLFFFWKKNGFRLRALQIFWHFVLWKARISPADTAKEAIWDALFGGFEENKFRQIGEDFCVQILPSLFRPGAVEKLLEYQHSGARVVIVTASAPYWILPWCRAQGFDLLATEYAVETGKFTGRYLSKNCRGEEKVFRIHAAYLLSDYNPVIAFGDTPDDRPMLALADEAHYRYFG